MSQSLNIQKNWYPKAAGSRYMLTCTCACTRTHHHHHHHHLQEDGYQQTMIEMVISNPGLVLSATLRVDNTWRKMQQGHVCYSIEWAGQVRQRRPPNEGSREARVQRICGEGRVSQKTFGPIHAVQSSLAYGPRGSRTWEGWNQG